MYSNLRLLCICFLFSHPGFATDKKDDSGHELQIVIDVSGSMKHTDSSNLRVPAVRLLINLLPKGTKAGIWLFAQKTSVLVKPDIVNEQWKNKALTKLNKIHSKGLFTNIEDAINQSSQHWINPSLQQQTSKSPRNIILLTDGMVDISKDIMQSAESRERILVDQIQQLQMANVKVHTIALSDNADAELMNKLAFDTNGWSETAESAEQLQKIFFKLFKKTVPLDTVPIKGNTFNVDSSIKELSVLIFKESGSSVSQLLTPDNKKISQDISDKRIVWLAEKNYDLVTIKMPKAGEWKILAEMDPDNQVMIVTDLKLNVDEMPNYITIKEAIDLTAYFTDQQQLISREDFLSLINISIHHSNEQGDKMKWKMLPVLGKAGLFKKTITDNLSTGTNSFKIIANGKTFQRESVQTIEVIDSQIEIETEANQAEKTVKIKLIPIKTVLDTEMMAIEASITQSGHNTQTLQVKNKDGIWGLLINVNKEGEEKIVNFSIMAKTLTGKTVYPHVKPIVINDEIFSKSILNEIKTLPAHETKLNREKVVENDPADQEKVENEAPVEEDKSVNWIKTVAIVITINILLIIAGVFSFKFIKKKNAEKQAELLERLE